MDEKIIFKEESYCIFELQKVKVLYCTKLTISCFEIYIPQNVPLSSAKVILLF